MAKIRVLVVDDSIVFRETLKRLIDRDIFMEVVGTATDAFDAEKKIDELKPDVITLDNEMPRMNGIEFLKKLIPEKPIPVVVVTSSAVNAFEAVGAGAVDYIKKPMVKSPADMEAFVKELCAKIRIARLARVARPKTVIPAQPVSAANIELCKGCNKIIALGASTGGTDALQTVLMGLPKECPPIVIVQHMPAGFTKMYADRLNRVCAMEVREAKNGDRLAPGLCIVGAGEFHLRLEKDVKGYYVTSKAGEKVSGHCPSVDVLFESVARTAKENAVGAILTGMGADGAKGLLAMRKAGAFTIGQDKETCVVYGMPMVAFNIGAVEKQAPLSAISTLILSKLK